MNRSVLACGALALAVGLCRLHAAALAGSLAGAWRLDPARSTELSSWTTFDLVLALTGDTVTVERKLSTGRRQFTDRLTVDTTKPETVAPLEWWADNRHLGAYLGHDHTRRIHAQWLENRRILRLSCDLVLETQQGPHAVNILSDYKVSANGQELTLIELRSTRNRPIVYVFKRLVADQK